MSYLLEYGKQYRAFQQSLKPPFILDQKSAEEEEIGFKLISVTVFEDCKSPVLPNECTASKKGAQNNSAPNKDTHNKKWKFRWWSVYVLRFFTSICSKQKKIMSWMNLLDPCIKNPLRLWFLRICPKDFSELKDPLKDWFWGIECLRLAFFLNICDFKDSFMLFKILFEAISQG